MTDDETTCTVSSDETSSGWLRDDLVYYFTEPGGPGDDGAPTEVERLGAIVHSPVDNGTGGT